MRVARYAVRYDWNVNASLRKTLDPYIKLLPFLAIGLVVIAIAVVWIFYMQRGAHIELRGTIQKVRTLALDENSSAVIIDFRVTNPSDYAFVVRRADVYLTDPAGVERQGMEIGDADAKQLFQYFPALGQKYNQSLGMRARIAPRSSADRMLAVRFEVPEALARDRKALRIRVEEVSGPISEMTEGRR
jgi:hypothetical protein